MNNLTLKMVMGSKNWGDAINPLFYEMITGKKCDTISIHDKLPENQGKSYLMIGSTLGFADSNTVVWGAGLIRYGELPREKPLKVCSVRGPLSREALIQNDIACPAIFGDPILLLPRYYTPKSEKKYKLGIVPHFIDKNNSWLKTINDPEVKVIDIEGDFYQVIEDICSCERIASSSLHGVILPDAYGIPSIWLEFSDKVIGSGFKFRDYFLSVGRRDSDPLRIKPDTTINEIIGSVKKYNIEINLDKLFQSNPFTNKL